MIKNISFLISFSFSIAVFAQCDVNNEQAPFLADPVGSYDMQYVDGSIVLEPFSADYDTLTAFPHAIENEIYEAVVGVRIPNDTSFVYDLGSGPQLFENVQINSIAINSVEGIPMGFNWECVGGPSSPEDCSWTGGDYGCIRFYSDAVMSGLSGVYPLNVLLDVSASYDLFGIPVPIDLTVDDLLDYYVLVIDEDNSSSIHDILDTRKFDILSTYPNPAIDKFTLEYGNDKFEKIDLRVYDLLGNIILHETSLSRIGHNQISFNVDKLVSGIYNVILSNNDKVLTKSMVIK